MKKRKNLLRKNLQFDPNKKEFKPFINPLPPTDLEILGTLVSSSTQLLDNLSRIPKTYETLTERIGIIEPFLQSIKTIYTSTLFFTAGSICSEDELYELNRFKRMLNYFVSGQDEYVTITRADQFTNITRSLRTESLLAVTTDVAHTEVAEPAYFANEMWDELTKKVPHIVSCAQFIERVYTRA